MFNETAKNFDKARKDNEVHHVKKIMQSNNWTANDVFEELDDYSLEQTGARLDLHGCSVMEAKQKVIHIINEVATQNNADVIHVITGRGKHINSNGTSGVLFKKMQEWVQEPQVALFVKEIRESTGAYLIVLNRPNKKPARNQFYQLTEKALLQIAKTGNKDAQFAVGLKLLKKGDKNCQIWLLKAASQEDTDAMGVIGYCYALGRTVQYNPKEAMKWYEKASVRNVAACISLGTMFWSGEAGIVDFEKVIYWYKAAEKLGSIKAQRLLGIIFFKLKRYEEAAHWNQKAADNDPHAKTNLASQLQDGLGIQEDKKSAATLFEEAAKEGVLEAKMRFGHALFNGIGIDRNYKLATKLFLEVGLTHNSSIGADCQFFLYLIYRNGLGCNPNFVVANNWLKRAAENKHPDALLILQTINISESKLMDADRVFDVKENKSFETTINSIESNNNNKTVFATKGSCCPYFAHYLLIGAAATLAFSGVEYIRSNYFSKGPFI